MAPAAAQEERQATAQSILVESAPLGRLPRSLNWWCADSHYVDVLFALYKQGLHRLQALTVWNIIFENNIAPYKSLIAVERTAAELTLSV